MSMKSLLGGMDRGFYADVSSKGNGQNAVGYFAALAEKAGVAPDDAEAIKRERSFLRRFGIKNPDDDDYTFRSSTIRKYARDTYAIEKAFQDLGMTLRGRNTPTVEKVFASTTSQNLFPIYFEAQAVAGILATSLVPFLVTSEEQIDSHTADHLTISDTPGDRSNSKTGEGARLPEIRVKTTDQGVKLSKFGVQFLATYEAVRLTRIDVMSRFIQRVGTQIGIDETDDLLDILIAGDGNTGSAVVDTDALVSGTFNYNEIIRLYQSFKIGYEFRQAVVNDTLLNTILNMAEFKDAFAGFDFQRTGQMVQPVGAAWHRWTSTGSSSFSTDRIVAVDDRYAVVQYTEGGTLTEADRLIDRQFERSTISKWTGFGKLDYDATQSLDVTA